MERTFIQWMAVIIDRYGVLFLRGAGITLMIAIVGTLVGFIIGLFIGAIRTIPTEPHRKKGPRYYILKLVNAILVCYIEVIRGTPMMVQAIVIYYGLMEAFNLDISALSAGLLVVSLNTGAYSAEITRGGIQAIDPGQTEAAKALGMTHWQTMFKVIFPQTIRNILPATGNELVVNIKDTAVLNVITVNELFFMTKTVQGVAFRNYEPFLIAGVLYLIMTLSAGKILRMIEKRLDGPANYTLSSRAKKLMKGS